MSKVGIKRYNCFVDAEEPVQELEVSLGVYVNAKDYAAFVDKFLIDFQKFLDERK